MAANTKLMEALLRVEHKLDIMLEQVRMKDVAFPKVGDINHHCPLCAQLVEYQVDITDAVVIRKCGCSTGKIALDMGAFAPPALPARKTDDGGNNEQEDWGNSNGGGGTKRR